MQSDRKIYNQFDAYLESDTIQDKLKENWQRNDVSRLFNDFASESIRHKVAYKGIVRLATSFTAVDYKAIKEEREQHFQAWLKEAVAMVLIDLFDSSNGINSKVFKAISHDNLNSLIIKSGIEAVKEHLLHTYFLFIGEEICNQLHERLGMEGIAWEIDNIEDPNEHTISRFRIALAAAELQTLECIKSKDTSLNKREIYLQDMHAANEYKGAYELIFEYKNAIIHGEQKFIHFHNPIDAFFAYTTHNKSEDKLIVLKLPARIPHYAAEQLRLITQLEMKQLPHDHTEWLAVWEQIKIINAQENKKARSPASLEEQNKRQECYEQSLSGEANQLVMLAFNGILHSMQPEIPDKTWVFATYASPEGEIYKGYITSVQHQQLERILTAIAATNQGQNKRSEHWYHALFAINKMYDTAYSLQINGPSLN